MAQVSYPGVYIEEVPSGVRAISAVSTSVAAFVDRFRRGPVNQAVQIFGMADFERVFGGIDEHSLASYAIAQFFLNGGSQAWVVRVAAGSFERAAVGLGDVPAGAAASAVTLQLRAREAGTWANQRLRVRVDYPRASDGSLAGTFTLNVTEYESDLPTARVVRRETFGPLAMATGTVHPAVVDRLLDSALVEQVPTTLIGANLPAPNGLYWTLPTPAAGASFFPLPATTHGVPLTLTISVPELPPSTTFHTTTLSPFSLGGTGAIANAPALRLLLENAIRTQGVQHAALAGATVQHIAIPGGEAFVLRAGPGAYDPRMKITAANAGLGATLNMAGSTTQPAVSSPQEYVLGVPGLASPVTGHGGHVRNTVGSDGDDPGALALVGTASDKTGMHALVDVDVFNMLCLPKAAELRATSGDLDTAEMSVVYNAGLALCRAKRAMLLVDPHEELVTPNTGGVNLVDFAGINTWFDQFGDLRDPNAALFYPRVAVPDPANDFEPRLIGPSGTMAGIFARTDAERGVWQAPAGVEAVLRGVTALEVKMGDGENGVLNKLAVNCLRSFPVQGRIAWGARTLDGPDDDPSEWKYIPIRRLALMIEESLFRGTKWAVFRPNDEPLWAQLRQNVGAFMHRLFRQKAFQGATPREAYFVKCDRETNPPEDRELGIVTVEVGFAPLKPAEFVIIRIQQIAEITA